MQLVLRIAHDEKSGKGIIQIAENKSPMVQPIIGYLSYQDEEQRKFFVDALLKGGKFGEVQGF